MTTTYAATAARILDTATHAGGAYADVQFWGSSGDTVSVQNGVVRTVDRTSSTGYGIRVLVDGSWGFVGSDRFEPAALDAAAVRAVAIAKAGTRVAGRLRAVTPTESYVDTFATPLEIDPATVGLTERTNLLLAAEKALHVSPRIVLGYAYVNLWETRKSFFSTTGSAIEQRIVQSGGGVGCNAVGPNGDAQQRSGPGAGSQYQSGGWEVVKGADLVENAARYGREAVLLTDAPVLPKSRTALIVTGNILNLQMHESVGHALELDRSLGWEANFSGVSWATPEQVGKLRYGSDLMNVYADNTLPGGMATVGYDDEGVKPVRVPLIERGILKAFLSSRDTAMQAALPRTASVHAESWSAVPMVRMSNIVLAPGSGTLEEIVAETQDGVLMDGIRSWSIDDHRLNFQFGPEIAWEIKRGKRGRIFRNPTYVGVTPAFWGSLDRVAGASEMVVYGTPNCGKGEPEQSGRTSHACSHARFADVLTGVKANG